jgi:transposase-like protein
MKRKVEIRYSSCFKRQVIEDLESGRFGSLEAARRHYGIGGACTIGKWLKAFGRNELLPKVVRVERLNEADQVSELRKQIQQLQRALGQTQAENVLNQEYLSHACQELGMEVEAFKKKSAGQSCMRPRHPEV